MLTWFKTEPIDWSDIERLEQRIRDIRRRIRQAKGTQKQFLPPPRMDTQKTIESLRNKSANLRTSLREGKEILPSPSQDQQNFQRKRKETETQKRTAAGATCEDLKTKLLKRKN